MKTYIALVRHGVTDWNYDARMQGHTDVPLNPEGERQAEAMADRLATERWDAVYSSDLCRARATAMALCRRTGHQLVVEPRLRERQIGMAEGTTALERRLRWPEATLADIPGVETDGPLGGRGEAIITEIARRHPGQRVVIVTHGGIIATFLRRVLGDGAFTGISRNTGISPVVYDGEGYTAAGPHDYRHLLVDGVEYSGEKYRLLREAQRSGLPGLALEPELIEDFILRSTAVEAAWVDGRLVAYARAFTDGVCFGYIDLLYTQPGHKKVGDRLLERLGQRFPKVRFERLTGGLEEHAGA